MGQRQKKFRISNICIRVESDTEFGVSSKYLPFEDNFDEEDVCIHIRTKEQAESLDLSPFQEVYHTDLMHILACENRIVKLRYQEDAPDQLDWCLYQNTDSDYLLNFYGTARAHLAAFHVLYFLDLSSFLIRFQAMILHAAAIRVQDQGIVFTAPSGTGKSTQAELWRKYCGSEIINGDRAIIRKEDMYRIYGSTFAGSSGIYKNETSPLTAVVVLRQAKYNRVHKMSKKEAYLCILSEMSISKWNKETISQQAVWVEDLLENIPVYLLECMPDQESVTVLYNEIRKSLDKEKKDDSLRRSDKNLWI